MENRIKKKNKPSAKHDKPVRLYREQQNKKKLTKKV